MVSCCMFVCDIVANICIFPSVCNVVHPMCVCVAILLSYTHTHTHKHMRSPSLHQILTQRHSFTQVNETPPATAAAAASSVSEEDEATRATVPFQLYVDNNGSGSETKESTPFNKTRGGGQVVRESAFEITKGKCGERSFPSLALLLHRHLSPPHLTHTYRFGRGRARGSRKWRRCVMSVEVVCEHFSPFCD